MLKMKSKLRIMITLMIIMLGISLPIFVYAYDIWHQGVDAYDKVIERWSGFASATKSDIETAAGTWNNLYDGFDFLCMGSDHNNTTDYPEHDEHNQITKIDAGSSTIYLAEITVVDKTWVFWPFTWMVNEADINLNGNSGVYWHNNPPNSQYFDVQSVVLHEFGHFLGLNHSNDGDAVMYNSISGGVIKRSLYYDDSNGIYSIYD